MRFFPFSFSLYSNFTSFALLFFVAVACCYFSPNISICLHPLGVGVCVDQTNLFNLHRRSFDSIVMYNCTQGSERTAEKGSPNQSFINIFIYWINTINKTIYLLIELNYSSLVFFGMNFRHYFMWIMPKWGNKQKRQKTQTSKRMFNQQKQQPHGLSIWSGQFSNSNGLKWAKNDRKRSITGKVTSEFE